MQAQAVRDAPQSLDVDADVIRVVEEAGWCVERIKDTGTSTYLRLWNNGRRLTVRVSDHGPRRRVDFNFYVNADDHSAQLDRLK